MTKISTHVFNNGLPTVYLARPDSLLYTVSLIVGAGPRFESQSTQGISRFYANVCLQGSEQYPDKKTMAEATDQLGLSFKAQVSPEYSLIHFSAVKEVLPASLELVLNTYFKPTLTKKNIDQEKKLTSAEIKYSSKAPQLVALNTLLTNIFNNTSLGFSILGQQQAINQLDQSVLQKFKDQYYVSQNCLLTIVGPDEQFPFAEFKEVASIVPQGPRPELPGFDFSQVKVIQDKVTQMGKVSHLTFASLCNGRQSSKRVPQSLLLNILSQGKTNQRLKSLRKKKLVRQIRPWIKMYSDCGLFLIQTSCLPAKEKEVQEAIEEQLEGLTSQPITQTELAKAKNYYQNNLMSKLDKSLELGLFTGLSFFFNLKEQTPEDVLERIKKTSLEEVREISQTIFRPDLLSWVIVGPGY